jgi:hypothetical protein
MDFLKAIYAETVYVYCDRWSRKDGSAVVKRIHYLLIVQSILIGRSEVNYGTLQEPNDIL